VGHSTRLLRALTLLSPLALLLALELALRLVGFGGHPLFVDAPDLPGYRQANPELIRRYLRGAPDLAIDAIPFREQKASDAYRIVVQGESTAAGFPYGRWAGLAGMLGDRLEAAFPDREIEVISSAMAAVNSYALLDLVDEIIAIEPDAVLIYAGHNEYLGILGVGSALGSSRCRPLTLLHLKLTRLRLYQLLQALVDDARFLLGRIGGDAGGGRATMIARAAAGARIPYGSDAYRRGALQLEANLGAMLEKYRRAGIRVYLGTLVSNEKDFEPFESPVSEQVSREEWDSLWQQERRARRAGDTQTRRRALARLLELDANSADAWYALGELERAAGAADAARTAYRNARDRDPLRLRAPEAFHRVIERVAQRHGATLVDVQRDFEEASPDGIVGDELLLEHVHPNAEGYFLLADAYARALARDGEVGDWSHAPSRERARRDMPITALDRILAEYTVRELEAQLPFSDAPRELRFATPKDEIEGLAQQLHRGEIEWLDAMERLLQIHREAGRIGEAAVVARMAAQAYPSARAPNFAAGRLLMELEEFARARRYLERSLRLEPDAPATLEALVRANLELGDPARAAPHLARLEQVAPSHPLVRRFASQRGLERSP
jgi:lysophospholipase L1-like esterase